MIENHRIGIEFEVSDINTFLAAKKLYEYFGMDFSEWSKLTGFPDKLNVSYDQWNAVFDASIVNSDGSTCMFTYRNNKNIEVMSRKNLLDSSQISKGIEIISPPSNSYEEILNHLNNLIQIMTANGATISKKLNNALHIHIDASNLSLDQIKQMPKRIYSIQEPLNRLMVPDTLPIVPLYTLNDAEILAGAKSEEDFYDKYMVVDGNPDSGRFPARRIINVKPWLVNPQESKTIEFRCFSATPNIDYTRECINLSLDIFNYLVYNKEIPFDLDSRVKHIESLYL